MASPNLSIIKLALLGHGDFAKPSFDKLKKNFPIVKEQNADCLVVANYGRILTKIDLSRPKFGAINLHGSLLPKYRGASPVQTAIKNGDRISGVTIIKLDEKVDHGPILAKQKISIGEDDTTHTLQAKMGKVLAKLILPTLDAYFSGRLIPKKQEHRDASYTNKITREAAVLSLDADSQTIYNYFRAYGKEPGLFIQVTKELTLKIMSARMANNKFIPLIVQKPGKKKMSYQEFLNGWRGKPLFVL